MTVSLTVEPTATAPALDLRPWRVDDSGELLAAHRDPLLRRWLTTPLDSHADTLCRIEAQNEGWAAGTRLSFAVLEVGGEVNDGGRLVGHVVVKCRGDLADTSAEVG